MLFFSQFTITKSVFRTMIPRSLASISGEVKTMSPVPLLGRDDAGVGATSSMVPCTSALSE